MEKTALRAWIDKKGYRYKTVQMAIGVSKRYFADLLDGKVDPRLSVVLKIWYFSHGSVKPHHLIPEEKLKEYKKLGAL